MRFFSLDRLFLSTVATGLLIGSADATVTVVFTYDGANTIGTVTGSMILPATHGSDNSQNLGATYLDAGKNALLVHVSSSSSYDGYNSGTPVILGKSILVPDQWTGTTSFGFGNTVMYVSPDSTPGEDFAPTGSFIWNNRTLAEVGVSDYTTPQLAYTASNGSQIFYLAIPEPTSLVLASVALAGFVARRKR